MKKYFLFIVSLSLFVACQSGSKKNTETEKGVLTVTIEPQRYFLEQIVGDAFTINTLVPPGASPETYEPAPSVMVEMGKSQIYFMVGDLGFERAWSGRLATNNRNILMVDCSTGIERIEGGEHTDHDHGHANEHNHKHDNDAGHDHDTGYTDEHNHVHNHGDTDPHIWTSPRAVKIMTANMLEALVKVDPDNKETYQANYERFIGQLTEMDSLIQKKLANVTSRAFIIYHPALAYFSNDYNFHQHSVEFQGKNPSPAQIKELVDLARKEQIHTLFMQKGFDAKNMEVIARELGAELFEIDPLNYAWDKELMQLVDILARDVNE